MQAPPIDKLMDKIHSIYKLVILSSRRTIELADGAQKLVNAPADAKPSDIALKEIIKGKISYKVKEGK
ncbi:MAG: DNA-directed RNA polymerase subunit omega [Omnitrophica bacterium RIFCSPLOWO2_02_FULL_45_16]|nr:MAG: DNA-directed RNA polymerase subunit omega [Omnitrophica bacterium RIFCSPHIGHO2_02_FULL_46_20]OGW94318.1 MAG: DNA-directed RNA polymerase subunit omega [Omnitrophica bacterium RIFCSPLOWO2_12_FULL_45_13]OGW99876.1 MAG: DNA-directed RNA polymerase subunit omega [Omnitrophica bacterium RIFCSPLOWO2_02_FULL_45_16]